MPRPTKRKAAAHVDAHAEALALAVAQSADTPVPHLVKDAARAYVRSLQIRLTAHTVSYGHWTILRVLWEQDGLAQRTLAERAGVTEPTTFTAVKSLEGLGYIERMHLPGDNKKVHVFLTKTGRALRKKLLPLADQVHDISLEGITAQELETTRKVLIAIAGNLAQDELASQELGKRMPSTQELGRLMAGS